MSVLLFVVIPMAWALTGKLLGMAVTTSCFYSARGKRAGLAVGRWCVAVFPIVYLALLLVGAGGDAGHGFHLFGSEELLGLIPGIPIYALPVLSIYVGGLYMVRDLTLGHMHDRKN
jgi:hypothetical protein